MHRNVLIPLTHGVSLAADLFLPDTTGPVPCLVSYYPYHKDEHQKMNAEPLVQAGGAVLVKDHIDAKQNAADGCAALMGLVRDTGARARMKAALAKLGPADGSTRLSAELLKGSG